MSILDNYYGEGKSIRDKITELEEENRKLNVENKHLKEVYEACNLDSINKAFKISNLEMENKKLKEIRDKYVPMALRLENENKKLKNLKICGKTVEERIEIDKGIVRE